MTEEFESELAILERELRANKLDLRFSPELEGRYFHYSIKKEQTTFNIVFSLGALIYFTFWIFDFLIVPDILVLSGLLRFGIALSLLMCVWIFVRWPKPFIRDVATVFVATLCNTGLVIMIEASASPLRSALLLGIPLVLWFIMVLRTITFRAMLYISILNALLFTYAVTLIPEVPQAIILGGSIIMYTLFLFLCIVAYLNEQDRRQIYLLQMSFEYQKKQLQANARTDHLTRLHNRHWVKECAPDIILNARRTGQPVGAAMIDIDHFKAFNDRYGHLAGDDCIASVAEIARRVAGEGAYGIRFGGEELLFLFPNCDMRHVKERSEQICAAVRDAAMPHLGNPCQVVTVSIGCTSMVPATDHADESCTSLIETADKRLYLAKRSGRNKVCADVSQTEEVNERPMAIA